MAKICYGCLIEKDFSEFRKDKRHKDSLGTKCKDCDHSYDIKRNKKWREYWSKNDPYLLYPSKIKRCLKCKKNKSVYDFNKNCQQAHGLCSACKQCCLEQFRLKRYGVKTTGKECWICKTCENLTIDHCHNQNKLRGTLCRKCNIGLGHFKDRKDLLLRAVEYLEGDY